MSLDKEYSRDDFLAFLSEFLPDFEPDVRQVPLPGAVKTITRADKLGSSDQLDLTVFEFAYAKSLDKRVTLASDGFRIMKESASFQALIAYQAESTGNWRLSLMTATPEISENGKVIIRLSNPRRHSFTLGPNAKINTPTKYLIQKGSVSSIKDLLERFSLEVVNREFYTSIAELYTELVGGIRGDGAHAKKFPGVLKLPAALQHSEHMQEFAVRLIGRLVFCWFLREKKGENSECLISKDLLSLRAAEARPDYYHTTLEPLFYQVLNKQLDARRDAFRQAPFASIPYLNGGLFAPQEDDDHYSYDDDSQAKNHDQVKVPDEWLRSFFILLEQYNFTVDENTSIDIDLSIDPEMLGRIFENLLAEINPETGESARKSTGSFYTPRQIVEYMVDHSIIAYLEERTGVPIDKLRVLASYDLTDDGEHLLGEAEQHKVIDALSAMTILDPACGSGAFPIGALQKIVFMLQRADPDAKLWFDRQLQGASPEVRRLIEREFEHKNFDYIRKLGVIRQSIYGVDIQPIATEIARLRCFLTLIVDERIDETLPNRGIEPLPNLDFKFVTANSLVKLPSIQGGGQIGLFEDQSGIAVLKSLRAEYFSASAVERDSLKLRFVQTQNKMFQRMIQNARHADLTQKLSAWDPFSHNVTSWFDPEWMFGIGGGFGIIITNPPYLKERDNQGVFSPINASTLGQQYHQGKMDLWYYFLHRGIELAETCGIISFITSRYWLNSSGSKKLIAHVRRELSIIDFLDIQKLKVFDSVAGQHMVATYVKDTEVPSFTYRVLRNDLSDVGSEVDTPNIQISRKFKSNIFASNGQIFLEDDPVDYSGTVPLERQFNVSQGVVQNPDKVSNKFAAKFGLRTGAGVFVVSKQELADLGLNASEMAFVRPFYDENAIHEFRVDDSKPQYLIYLTKENCPDITLYPNLQNHFKTYRQIMDLRRETTNGSNKWFHLHWPRKAIYFEGPKIVMPGMFDTPRAAFQDSPGYFGLSSNIVTSVDQGSLLVLLGVLNSNFAAYWFSRHTKKRGVGVDVGVSALRQFPVPPLLRSSGADALRSYVRGVLNDGLDVRARQKLNHLVYEVYDFSPDEVQLIESSDENVAVLPA